MVLVGNRIGVPVPDETPLVDPYGAPAVRADYDANYYAAFVVDPDGYRIEAYYGPGET